jgi:hypothetical protein
MVVLLFAREAGARQTQAKPIRSENLREEASQAQTMA